MYTDEWTPYASYLAFEIAEYSDPRHCASTEQPDTRSSTNDQEKHTGDDDNNNKLWVRLIFNDEVQLPTKIISEFGPLPSVGYESSTESSFSSSVWIPYSTFLSYLKLFAISTEEYQSVCPEPLSGSSAASAQMQEELRATIGDTSKRT